MKKITLSDGREMEVAPLKTGHMRKAMREKSDVDQTVMMVSYSTGLTIEQVDELDFRDFSIIQEALTDYLKK